jgi:iron complex transport system substrate-binding protein
VFPPHRIVCLTAETVETLYLLGAATRIAGITGYAVRPPRARREKPRIAAFTTADIPQILALQPDLVLAFSDLQADIVAELVRRGAAVHVFNQRSIAGILEMIALLGALVDEAAGAEALIGKLSATIDATRRRASTLPRRPLIYFEEWDEPMICGIGWISELIEIAGGVDIFADRARAGAATDRRVCGDDIIDRAPDAIVASWCGKKFRRERLVARPGFAALPAVRNAQIYEIAAPLILQPGPSVVTDGLAALERIVRQAATSR